MTIVVKTLAEALKSAPSLPWRDALNLPVETPWELSTPAIVSNPDDLHDVTAASEAVPAPGMRYALSIAEVQDILDNARQQRPDCPLEDLLKAFVFYFERDAFIEFGGSSQSRSTLTPPRSQSPPPPPSSTHPPR